MKEGEARCHWRNFWLVNPAKLHKDPEKWCLEVGRLFVYWDGIISGAMLNFMGGTLLEYVILNLDGI